MRFLLDTHIFLWLLLGNQRLPTTIREMLSDRGNDVIISAVVPWEIGIKHALVRRSRPELMPISGHDAIELARSAGCELLPISPKHAAAAGALPLHHRDPFDRLLVAQAFEEPLRLITSDRKVAAYGEAIMLI